MTLLPSSRTLLFASRPHNNKSRSHQFHHANNINNNNHVNNNHNNQNSKRSWRYGMAFLLVSAPSLYFLMGSMTYSHESLITAVSLPQDDGSGSSITTHGDRHHRYEQQITQQQQHDTSTSSSTSTTSSATSKPKLTTRHDLLLVALNTSSQEPVFSQVKCTIDEFFYHNDNDEASSSVQGSGTKRPVVLRNYWKHSDTSWDTEQSFLQAYGHIPYYIKDRYVQVRSDQCVAQFQDLWQYITSNDDNNNNNNKRSLLAFTNDKENPALFGSKNFHYDIPDPVQHINSFAILSTMTNGQSHEFHKHGESWIAQAAGHKVWWFLDSNQERPPKVNACDYLTGREIPPPHATTCLQSPGDVIWFPQDWYHATCSLTDWNIGIGRQLGPRIRQEFPQLPLQHDNSNRAMVQETLDTCSGNNDDKVVVAKTTTTTSTTTTKATSVTDQNFQKENWKWYDGDINKYYNDLEVDHKRNPNDINDFAVHRWMGTKRSTQIHYELINESIWKHYQKNTKTISDAATVSSLSSPPPSLKVLDAGCGLGSALMWMEQKEPSWQLEGRTLSEQQANFIKTKLPPHKFKIELESYDNLGGSDNLYDAIYSIEAMIHSTDIQKTLHAWSTHLKDHGVVIVIDDFLLPHVNQKEDPDVDLFARSWLANSLYSVSALNAIARQVGLELVESRDLVAEYRIVELNYRNQLPSLDPEHKDKNHQGWMGSKYRQKLTVEGKLGYNLLVFRKISKLSQ